MKLNRTPAAVCKYGNAAVVLFFALYAFLIPAGIIVYDLLDPGIRTGKTPRAAWRLHRSLTTRYAKWARKRIASCKAVEMSAADVSGTEWPLFGSVLYLWATESLQEAWEKDPSVAPRAPKEYARETIEAATELVIDPNHATWVRKHWGADYLHTENVFYRMLVIAALTTHARLTDEDRHLPMLRDQVESLSKELDESRHGLLEDYPAECYPGDVLTAVACIRRADAVLGTDHSVFAKRALRGFQGRLLDGRGLVPYAASARAGIPFGPSRGCGNSYVCLCAPELWPEAAARWYDRYEAYFWQYRWAAFGFREFPRDMAGRDWYMDVDSGPVIAGHGISACAFGAGAARVNGRFDHAYPLTAEMLVTCWPLPGGTLAGPRILSNAINAPYLGEAAILFSLTRGPAGGVRITEGGVMPPFVLIVLFGYFGMGGLLIVSTIRHLRRWRRQGDYPIPHARGQLALWVVLAGAGALIAGFWCTPAGLFMVLAAQLLPRGGKTSPQPSDENPGD